MNHVIWKVSMFIYELLFGKRPVHEVKQNGENGFTYVAKFDDGTVSTSTQEYNASGELIKEVHAYDDHGKAKIHADWMRRTRKLADRFN